MITQTSSSCRCCFFMGEKNFHNTCTIFPVQAKSEPQHSHKNFKKWNILKFTISYSTPTEHNCSACGRQWTMIQPCNAFQNILIGGSAGICNAKYCRINEKQIIIKTNRHNVQLYTVHFVQQWEVDVTKWRWKNCLSSITLYVSSKGWIGMCGLLVSCRVLM